MVSGDTPKFILVVVVVADFEESISVRLRDDDSMTERLVDQKDSVSGRNRIPIDPAIELRLKEFLIALGFLSVRGLDLFLLPKPSGNGIVLAEALDDISFRVFDQVAVKALELDDIEVIV